MSKKLPPINYICITTNIKKLLLTQQQAFMNYCIARLLLVDLY